MSYRVLITGSRTWDDEARIHEVLNGLAEGVEDELVLVHGACPKGADDIADRWAKEYGVKVERFPADWDAHGKSAGHKRNQIMVDTRPNEVIAFIRDASPGATGCVKAARKAGLNVREPYLYEQPGTTPVTEPPSTVRELRQVLIDFDANQPRSMQTALGPSEWGTPCQQQIARKLAGAPRRPDTEPKWAPFLGTAGHTAMETGVLPFWNTQLGEERWLAEDELIVAPDEDGIPGVHGHGDAFDQRYGMVVDWKFVSDWALNKLRSARRKGLPPAEQISTEYRVQAHSYGKGHARKGRPVRWVRLVLFARTSSRFDDSEEWTEAFDPAIADRAAARYFDTARMVREMALDRDPDQIALVPAEPGEACTFCPFHRPDRRVTDWQACSGLAGKNPGVLAMARLRRAGLLSSIRMAKSEPALVAIWRDAEAKGLWDDDATTAAKQRKEQLAAA